MRYNFYLRNYIDHNQNYYSPEYREYLGSLERPCNFWCEFDAFLLFLSTEILPMMECRDIETNKLLNEISIFESRASVDEGGPQHYGVATSALDWTSNPFIALYFAASGCVDVGPSSSMIITPALNFSLFEYKQLKDENEISIKLESPNNQIVNDRAVKQEGKFTFFTKANSFYLLNGRYPKIEDYENLNGKEFLLRKYDIQLNNDTISYIQNKLKELSINQNTLGLT